MEPDDFLTDQVNVAVTQMPKIISQTDGSVEIEDAPVRVVGFRSEEAQP